MKRLFLVFLAGALASCAFDPLPASGDEITSSISGSAFRPGTARTMVDQVVTFTNKDSMAHSIQWTSVPATASTASSAGLGQNQSYTYTPSAAGTYAYQCGIHSSMKGSLIVTTEAP